MEKRIDFQNKGLQGVPVAKLGDGHRSCLNDTFVLNDSRQERTGSALCNIFQFHQQDLEFFFFLTVGTLELESKGNPCQEVLLSFKQFI